MTQKLKKGGAKAGSVEKSVTAPGACGYSRRTMLRLLLPLLAVAFLFAGCTNRYPDSPVTDLPQPTPSPAGH